MNVTNTRTLSFLFVGETGVAGDAISLARVTGNLYDVNMTHLYPYKVSTWLRYEATHFNVNKQNNCIDRHIMNYHAATTKEVIVKKYTIEIL